ncbi:hypothetical protein FOZ61_000371 [Perkinsus olseni]|uniref:Uncharacterized protein n=1 Tax=Perkinsus olseni TaxID=32597 RepID=A0A7J6M114_PEROL|nr:hypothetical protein FOZ61_000371 [Perkinsus olseni]
MGQEISELNKSVTVSDVPAPLSTPTTSDYQSPQDTTAPQGGGGLQQLGQQMTQRQFDSGENPRAAATSNEGVGYLTGGLLLTEQSPVGNSYPSTTNLGRPTELGTGHSVMPQSQEEQLQQILLRHQGQVQRPHQGGQRQRQAQQDLSLQQLQQQLRQAQRGQYSRRQDSARLAAAPSYDSGNFLLPLSDHIRSGSFHATSYYNTSSLAAVESATEGVKIKRLSEEEVTKIVESEGYDDINIYDTSVPAGLKRVLAALHGNGVVDGLNGLESKGTKLSPNAVEFVPGKPYGSGMTTTTTSRLPPAAAPSLQPVTSGISSSRTQNQEQSFLQTLYEYGLIK